MVGAITTIAGGVLGPGLEQPPADSNPTDSTDSREAGTTRRRRLLWRAGLFVLVVLSLRWAALGDDPPIAGADAVPEQAQAEEDGDPAATERVGWLLADAGVLASGEDALACVRAGSSCSADGMLAVDTVRARAASLATALAEAGDPDSDAYLGRPARAVAEQAQAIRTAAAGAADGLARWLEAGCGSSVDGLPVATRPAGCTALGDDAQTALGALEDALQVGA